VSDRFARGCRRFRVSSVWAFAEWSEHESDHAEASMTSGQPDVAAINAALWLREHVHALGVTAMSITLREGITVMYRADHGATVLLAGASPVVLRDEDLDAERWTVAA
jgi:hypothetical protein